MAASTSTFTENQMGCNFALYFTSNFYFTWQGNSMCFFSIILIPLKNLQSFSIVIYKKWDVISHYISLLIYQMNFWIFCLIQKQ